MAAAVRQPQYPLRGDALGPVQAGKVVLVCFAHAVSDDRALSQFEVERCLDRFRAVYQSVRGGLAQFLGLLGHRLHLRLYEVHLQLGEALDVQHLHQPLCELESARDIARGITEDFIAQFRAAHDIAGNAALICSCRWGFRTAALCPIL